MKSFLADLFYAIAYRLKPPEQAAELTVADLRRPLSPAASDYLGQRFIELNS